jgi:hypothetical protein
MTDIDRPATDHSVDINKMVDPETLEALAARCEAGDDFTAVFGDAARALVPSGPVAAKVYDFWCAGAYADAVAALQRSALPGWAVYAIREYADVTSDVRSWSAELHRIGANDFIASEAPTEPLARLAAALRAKAAEIRGASRGVPGLRR